jgi:hypothetical protein
MPDQRCDAIYERVTVQGATIVSVRSTRNAERHGMSVAFPLEVVVARPAGLEPTTFRSAT